MDRAHDRALRRAGEAPRLSGNTVKLLRDGPAAFASWLADIAAARHAILLENYIFNSDRVGQKITDALVERARAGVEVFVLYDWFGCLGTSRSQWVRLIQAGAKVRAFRPLHLSDPLRVFQRNHRKTLCIDGVIAHVGGLCIGDAWAGDPAHGVPPWRDTAVRIHGPAALEIARAFNQTWTQGGPGLPSRVLHAHEPTHADDPQAVPPGGGPAPCESQEAAPCAQAPVRIIAGEPGRSRIYRLTQVLLTNATSRIWITDAYFLTPPALYESLLTAARDGVDVRVLLPGRSDLPWVSWAGRAGYVGLLEAGVRMFEWQGPMLHAKTMVVDGVYARIGSSNLNLASLLTNWELDVIVEDPAFSGAVEQMFLTDLSRSRELELTPSRGQHGRARGKRAQPASAATPPPDEAPSKLQVRGARGRTGTAVARASSVVLGLALRRQYERSAWSVSFFVALLLCTLAGIAVWQPRAVAYVLSGLSLWIGIGALTHAVAEWRRSPRKPRRARLRHDRTDPAPTDAPALSPSSDPGVADLPAALPDPEVPAVPAVRSEARVDARADAPRDVV